MQRYIGPCGVLVPTGTVHLNNEFEFEFKHTVCYGDEAMHSHLCMLCFFMLIVRSFLELTKFFVEHPKSHDKGFYILSSCFNQDPLKSYFGNVRAARWRNVNPLVQEV